MVPLGSVCVAETGVRGVALLIANGTYPDASVSARSAAKDANALADELKLNGFDVDKRQDLNKKDMRAAVDALLARTTRGATVLFYFSGVGIQVAHQTFLIPTDAEIWSEADVQREGVSIDNVVKDLDQRGAKAKIVIIDASRRNPFERRFRTYSAGLAGVDAPDGTLVMFAAAPNKLGRDSTDDVSLFMSEFVKELQAPGISVEEAMNHTRIGVSRASNGEQVPWVASSLVDPLYFAQADTASPPKSAVPPKTAHNEPPAPGPPPAPPAVAPAPSVSPPRKPPPASVQIRPATPPTTPPPTTTPPPATTAPSNATPTNAPSTSPTLRDCADCPEVVTVPAGEFDMGSGQTAYDSPVHHVTIPKPFAIGRTEVTFADWEHCVSDGGCKYQPDNQGFGGGDRPVINISWFDTKEYLAWLSKKTGKTYRLPSEAEWEYAAHGGTKTAYTWGNSFVPHKANCSDCGNDSDGRQTLPAGSFGPNGFGLVDMAGNAAEWVEDCWNLSYRGFTKDSSAHETGSCEQRVLRGGSFDSTSAYLKPTARFRYDADVRYWANGFRVLRELP